MTATPLRWVRFRWSLHEIDAAPRVPTGYTIRHGADSDGSIILDVVLQAYGSDPIWRPILDSICDRMCERIQTTLGHADTTYFLAVWGAAVVAVSGVAESHWTDQNLLTGICVLPQHQRRGLGTALLALSLLWLRERGVHEARVYTQFGSLADRKVYPRFGSGREADVEYPGLRPPPESVALT